MKFLNQNQLPKINQKFGELSNTNLLYKIKMILVFIIIVLVLGIGQSASTRNTIEVPSVYHHHHETHSYFINDKNVSKEEFDNYFKSFFTS